ncbi:hypothetical protein QYS60_23825 [Rhodococcus sp. GXMU-t2271]|uniref:hypothetical protein n=1 Tax=Rhodococcus sp. GXMU-t2271 TaxID=3059079 RepID=UPI00352B38E9
MRFEDTTYAKDATTIGDTYLRQLKEIRADNNLSDAGKRTQIENLYNTTKARLEQHRRSTEGDREARITSLQRKLFGTVGTTAQDAISHRDATDRASTVPTEDEAVSMMNNAIISNDKILQGALLKRAYDAKDLNGKPWMNVINTYEAAHPNDATSLQELLDLITQPPSNFAMTMFSALVKPAELGGWG